MHFIGFDLNVNFDPFAKIFSQKINSILDYVLVKYVISIQNLNCLYLSSIR